MRHSKLRNSTAASTSCVSCCLCLIAGVLAPASLVAQEQRVDLDPPSRQKSEKPAPPTVPQPKINIKKPPSILPPILWSSVVVAIVFVSIKLSIDYFDRRDRQRGWICPHCEGTGRQSVSQAENEVAVKRRCTACFGKGKIKA